MSQTARHSDEQAEEALYRIGLRWRDKQKFSATGDETDMAARVGKLAGRAVADIARRHDLEALMKAEQDVRDYQAAGPSRMITADELLTSLVNLLVHLNKLSPSSAIRDEAASSNGPRNWRY